MDTINITDTLTINNIHYSIVKPTNIFSDIDLTNYEKLNNINYTIPFLKTQLKKLSRIYLNLTRHYTETNLMNSTTVAKRVRLK